MKIKKNILFIIIALFTVSNVASLRSVNAVEKKDEIIIAFGQHEPERGWDPLHGSGHYGTSLFQSALLRRDTNLEIVKDLASDYSVSEDRLTWNVKLRDDIEFTDGEPLTAKDVEFTYAKSKELGTAAVDLTNLKSIEVVNDYEVNFILEEPDISFVAKMCSLGIVPKHLYNESYGENPVGTGPLKFVEWKKGEQLITEANENYHGDKIPFKKVTFLFIDSDQAATIAKSGVADIVRISNTDVENDFDGYQVVSLDTIDNRGLTLPFTPDNGEKTAEGYPIGNNVTSDIAIRKAMNIGIDRQKIIDAALNGYGSVASSIADNMPWWNPETKIENDGDIDQAKKILDEAGWKESSDGVREKDGVKAELDLYFTYKDRENIAVAVAQQLKEFGIKMTPIFGTWDDITPKMYSEVVLFGWGGYDPLEIYYNYSSNWRGKDYYNPNYYSNEIIDEYFSKALHAESEEEANESWKKAQWDGENGLSHLGDAPWVWLVNEKHIYLVRDGLEIGQQKIQPHGGGWPLVDTLANWTWQ
ncbi:ABC transporter substrate-binding protein [Ignavigranum ruoffiae]|uniref:ABC transporter substrate-binding protein n=1 Tax=Ignavigranum ruoffiae TaxID=89093 RepID=UPI0024AD8451|nr:ABC transporter substrate-binding protein [Ignavigranum ruoffiae]